MATAYVAQTLTNLRLAVYGRPLVEADFSIFERGTIERPAYLAELWVIGSSHALSIRTADGQMGFGEVLSSRAAPPSGEGRLDLITDFSAPHTCRHSTERIAYQVDVELIRCSMDEFLSEEATALAETDTLRLVYRFPENGELVSSPLTTVDVSRAEDGLLEVQTFHSYAEDLAVVRTHSIFSVHRHGVARD